MRKPGANKKTLFLSLTALGVVYGDIGTSPLYAINELFFGHGKVGLKSLDILGAISLVFWALTLLIAIKYIIFVLRADDEGKGGVFALYGLLNKVRFKGKWFFIPLLIIAAGLLFGDGIITPAISVISSTEGLANAASSLTPFVVPITLVILTMLFAIQQKGTAKVGTLFAPAIIVWFVSIAIIGCVHILHTPSIIMALNPYYALVFLFSHSLLSIFFALGAVILVITGGEALYADVGHFGTLPIRISWFTVVYPSLILNYLGQGAYLLGGNPVIGNNVFFSMVPRVWVYPMVVVATVATVIASQALISGAFSLASQAISLKLFPFFKVIHTYTDQEGQIYVPFINWSLYLGSVLLVILFHSSTNLASAYGLAVSGVMVITSLCMIQVARHYWKWKQIVAYAIFIPFILIDTSFFLANTLKIIDGGYVPILIGISLFFLMTTWKWGKTQTSAALNNHPPLTLLDLIHLTDTAASHTPKTAIIMTPEPILKPTDQIPLLNHLLLERYGLLPSTIMFLTVKQLDIPYCNKERFEIINHYTDTQGEVTSVVLHFGFRENPNAKSALERLAQFHGLHISQNSNDWFIHVIQTRATGERIFSLLGKIKYHIFQFISKNTASADVYFGLGGVKNISIEVLHVSLR